MSGVDGRHPCPKDGCPKTVPDELFACSSHWYELPQEVRSAIWKAYRVHGVGSPELFAAHAVAIAYWDDP